MRSKTLLLSIILFMTVITPMAGINSDIPMRVCSIKDPIGKGLHNPKVPVRCPSASINEHTLYIEGCDGCIMQLLDGDDIVYSAVIADGVVELPEELTGIYELQIIRGDYCFWAEIEL